MDRTMNTAHVPAAKNSGTTAEELLDKGVVFYVRSM
jgi:hypothetical protein